MVKAENGNDKKGGSGNARLLDDVIRIDAEMREVKIAETARKIAALLIREGGKQPLRSNAPPKSQNGRNGDLPEGLMEDVYEANVFQFLCDESKCTMFDLMLVLLIFEIHCNNNNLGNKIRDWLWKKFQNVEYDNDGYEYVRGMILGLQLVRK